MQVIAIGTLELILATGFIFVSGGLALCFQLGLTRYRRSRCPREGC